MVKKTTRPIPTYVGLILTGLFVIKTSVPYPHIRGVDSKPWNAPTK